MDCVFCKIASGAIPSTKLYEDSRFFCIRDLHPKAKAHLLVIPKEHVDSLDTAFPEGGPAQRALVGELFEVAAKVAREQKLLPSGFRAIINTGVDGGQTIFHLHLHLLGGEALPAGLL